MPPCEDHDIASPPLSFLASCHIFPSSGLDEPCVRSVSLAWPSFGVAPSSTCAYLRPCQPMQCCGSRPCLPRYLHAVFSCIITRFQYQRRHSPLEVLTTWSTGNGGHSRRARNLPYLAWAVVAAGSHLAAALPRRIKLTLRSQTSCLPSPLALVQYREPIFSSVTGSVLNCFPRCFVICRKLLPLVSGCH